MKRLTILVVDDEPAMRKAISRSLENYTFHLISIDEEITFALMEASSGEEALDAIALSPPDIILLDYKLPQMSGLDVLDRLAEKDHDLITIMITAYASLETAVRATKRGGYDFLAKPFTPEELKAVVYRATKHLELQRQAQRLKEEKKQFRYQMTSIVAHELKAPLAAIETYLKIIMDRSPDDDFKAYDKMLSRCLIRLSAMRKLIVDLLGMTQLESGRKKRDLANIDVVEIAETVADNMRPDADEAQITITLSTATPVEMTADRDEIEMILNNLVSNAIKYNQKGGKVSIDITSREGCVILRVADTGIGMTQEESRGLFDEFVRIKNEKTQDILGSGLGLSIVKKIVRLYDGDVTVETQPGAGSTFTAMLKTMESGSNS